jgi:tetratricopeptide (TPR) repeat protein
MTKDNEKYCAKEADNLSGKERNLFSRIEKAVEEKDVSEFEKKLEHTFPQQNNRHRIIYKAAVFFAVILGVTFILYSEVPHNKRIFRQFYSPYPPGNISGINRGNTQPLYGAAINLYISGNYNQAIPELSKMLKEDPHNYEIALLLAISYIETKQDQHAFETLDKIIDAPDNFFTDDAIWYKSLLSLKAGSLNGAKMTLKLIDPTSDYYPSSQKLLDKIENRD